MNPRHPIAARHKGFNRAEIVDQNFIEFVAMAWRDAARAARRRAGVAGQRAGCARLSRAVRIAADLAPPRPDGARAARAEQGVLHHRLQRPRGQRHGGAADATYRSGVPALPLRRVHGRAFPQAAGHGSGRWIRRCRSRPAKTIRPPAAATRSGAASRCGCCRRPRRSPRICPRRSAPRWRSSRRGASAITLPIPDDSHRDLFVRRRVEQPRHRADRVQRRRVDGVPETAGTGAVRVRGQRHRHLGEDAGRLGRQQFPATAPISTISSPTASTSPKATRRCSARVEHCRTHAPADLPASEDHARDGPRRHRLRDRVAQHRGTGRGGSDRSAAALGGDRAGVRAVYEGSTAGAVRGHRASAASRRPRRRIVAHA